MINETLYKKTVDILYQAYFNDTLQHGNCCACAVGNMVAANMGICFTTRYSYIRARNVPAWEGNHSANMVEGWPVVFYTSTRGGQCVSSNRYEWDREAKKQIDSTGYSWRDLAKIEYAFEMAPKGNCDEDWMFNGLCAVLDVLAEIHQADEPTQDEAVQPFVTHYATKQNAAI